MRHLRALALAIAVFAAGSASANSYTYVEAFTGNLLGNLHGEILVPSFNGSISDFLKNVQLDTLGTGFGSGYVGNPIQLTHTFAPNGVQVNSIQGAWLAVSVVDDLSGNMMEKLIDLTQPESALIQVNGGNFASGQATLNLLGGSVSNLIDSLGDSFVERISATRGDFRVLFSALEVKFDGTPAPAIPEPSAALAFGAALLLVGRRRSA